GAVFLDAVTVRLADPGVVDEQVDPAVRSFDVGQHRRVLVSVADVADDVPRGRRRALHLRRDLLEELLPAGNAGDGRAPGREVHGDAATEPGRRPRDDGDRTREVEGRIHRASSLLPVSVR